MADDNPPGMIPVDPQTSQPVYSGRAVPNPSPSGTASEPTDPGYGKTDDPKPEDVEKYEATHPPQFETEEERQKRYIENDKAAVDAQIRPWRKSADDTEKARAHFMEAQRVFNETQSEPDSPPPQPYQLPQQGQPPTQESKAATFLQFALPTALMVGLAIAGGRGKHGSLFMKNVIDGAFDSYAQGKMQESKRRQDQFWKMAQFQHQQNAERLANYRATLADKRFNLQQKMDIYKTYAQVYGDERAQHIADRQDLKMAQDKLKADEKMLADYQKKMLSATLKAGMLTRDSAHRDWYDVLRKMYYDRNGVQLPSDPARLTDEQMNELDALIKEEPFEKFREQRKNEGKTDTSTGKEQPYPGEESKDPDYIKHIDSVFGGGK